MRSGSIVLAGALIALATVLGLLVDRFELAGGTTINGIPATWRINTRTGLVSLCVAIHNPGAQNDAAVDQYRVQCN